jgi:3-oxoacyl-[acyl-carrier-protein] synthase-3
MRYKNVNIAGLGYELAPNVVTSEDLEARLESVYKTLRFQPGQLEALTGIVERRFWDRDIKLSEPTILAGIKALDDASVRADQIGMLVYGGVCRENLEPATACAVANGLDLPDNAQIFDLSNACLGVLNGMLMVANAIELGQIQAGLVVSCESSREIIETTIERLHRETTMDVFKEALATLTGGSGAVAMVLGHSSLVPSGHKFKGGVIRSATQYHQLCTWGPNTGIPTNGPLIMKTDSVEVLNRGVQLGIQTFDAFKAAMQWDTDTIDKLACHQVGSTHQRIILSSLGLDESKDFVTYRYLGNIGTAALPITAAIASERYFFQPGDKIGFLGIGSGLNCIMLGVEW